MPFATAIEPPPEKYEGPLSFERRVNPRTPVDGWALAAFTERDGAINLTRVEMADVSDGGMGIVCPVEVGAGTRVWVYPGGRRSGAKAGIVARCRAEGEQYRVGFTWSMRAAA